MANPLDLSKFKKISTEDSHTVLKHPDGHEIRVIHSALSPKVREQLSALPHYDDGGQVNNPSVVNTVHSMASGFGHADGGAVNQPTIVDAVHSMASGFGHAEGGPIKKEMYDGLPKGDRTEGFKQANARGNKIIDKQTKKYAEGGNVKLQQAHIKDKQPDVQRTNELPHYDDGGTVEAVKAMSSGFGSQGPKPEPTPTQDEKYEKIRQQNKANMGYAEGGDVSPSDDAHAHLAEAVKNLSSKYAAAGADMPAPTPSEDPNASAAALNPPQPEAAPEQSMATVPSANAPNGSFIQQGQQDVEQANKAEAAAGQNIAQEQQGEAGIQGEQAHNLQALHQKFEQIGDDLHNKYDNLAAAVEKGHIDPSHWWSSKSTGSQILTAIGMLFGGAGAGVSGHPEMAGQAIDAAINRDIDAQKADLGNKQTLLSKYMEQYNNLPQAEAAARLTMSATAEGLIKQQAAKLGSANAINAATQSIAQRRQNLLPQMEGLAKGQAMAQMYGGLGKPQGLGAAGPSGAEQAYQEQMRQMRILNPDLGKDMENKYLPNVGTSRVPVPDKLREDLTLRKDLSDKIAQLEVFAKKNSGTVLDRSVVNQGKAMAAQVQDAFRSAHQQGVFKESEKNFVNSILNADPTSFFSNVRTLPGYRQARKFNDQTINQYYKSYGIKPFGDNQSQGAGSQGPQTATMGGVKYVKVPGGWQKAE